MTTSYQLPTAVTYNGTGVNGWLNPNNILLVDNEYAVSGGSTNILQVGNFNLSIPQDSDITNFTIRVKGYRGSFNTTLQIYAVDNTTGVELSYPAAPFQGFSGTNTLYTLPSTLFGTTWTVDQANNIQLKLVANGELYLDAIEISADYVPQVTPVPPAPSSGQVVVDEFVQGQRFELAGSITDTELYAFTKSFTLPDGTPIQYADFHGDALITMDQGIPGEEENMRLTAIDHNYQGTGLTRLSFGSINNRGLKFIYPYDHDINLCRPHEGSAEFVISNSAPFYDRFLRKNQINALVSAPIIVQDESVSLSDPAHTLDFQGAGVSVVNDGGDSFKKIITITGNGVNPPFVSETSSATSGSSQVPSLTWSHVSSGINRLLVVQISTEAAATVSSVTYNGVALTQRISTTNGTLKNEQWTLTAPPVGTYNIIVSVTPNAYITCGAETFNTVNQTSPVGVTQSATGTSLTPSLVLATGTDNSLVVDSLSTGTLPIVYTSGAGQTENWHITANPNTRQGASSIEPAGSQPDNVTMSWSITQSIPWALNALEIKGLPSPVPGVMSVTGLDTDNTDPANPVVQISVDGVTITGDGTPGNPLVGATSADEFVKISATDTTSDYLNPKLNVHSSDGSVTVTTTITNPSGNEVLDVDLTNAGSGSGSWSLVATNTFSQSVNDSTLTTITQFSSLNGDTDDSYMILFEGTSGTPATSEIISLTFNNSTATNYYNMGLSTTGSPGANVTGLGTNALGNTGFTIAFGNATTTGSPFSGAAQIKATKIVASTSRQVIIDTVMGSVGLQGMVRNGGVWSDTTNNITSIEIRAYQTTGSAQTYSGKASLYKINR